MTTTLTIECAVHFRRASHGAGKELKPGTAPVAPPTKVGRVPRVSRLMALALRFDGMIRRGEVKSHVQLARLGRVTTARISQIMSLVLLAPDIQEVVLFLPLIQRGRASLLLSQLLPIAAAPDRASQRRKWRLLQRLISLRS